MLFWFVATGGFAALVQRLPKGKIRTALLIASPFVGVVASAAIAVLIARLFPWVRLGL